MDNDTLKRLLDSPEAMKALMNIEGFRNLNNDLTTIINKSEAVKKAKKEKTEASQKEKKELSDEEKEIKSKRKQIQEKLIKFATRIPVFMYLTDYREMSSRNWNRDCSKRLQDLVWRISICYARSVFSMLR